MCLQTVRCTLMGGRCAALTGWPGWRWRIFWRRATGCTARVTTLIASIAVHGSIARSASGKRVLRIGRTCSKKESVRRWNHKSFFFFFTNNKISKKIVYPAMVRKQFPWIPSSSSLLRLDWWWAADPLPRDQSDTRMPAGALYSAYAMYKQRCCSRRCPASQLYPSMFCFSLPTEKDYADAFLTTLAREQFHVESHIHAHTHIQTKKICMSKRKRKT